MRNRNWEQMTREELLALPARTWCEDSVYDSLLVFPTEHEHDSGFNNFALIGLNYDGTMERIGFLDDFWFWKNPLDFHMDCSMNGVFRFHSLGQMQGDRRNFKFGVGSAMSTIMITPVELP